MKRAPEIWAGVECTVNRVGDIYFDQLKYNGHEERETDLDLFAGIGLKMMRYPFLWEKTAPNGIEQADWSWCDRRIKLLKEKGITPIAGFLHHGSGPTSTNLLDPDFPDKLAEYARAFASRYPEIEYYTPINEILTTARFSALYGFWYPHKKSDFEFLKALLNEARGTLRAMKEIRKINPSAKLVQTDDLGKTTSTEVLKYQADFENERRWLGFDLLCGKVDSNHPLYGYFLQSGIDPSELTEFIETPCPPDVLGINTYPLSKRHLDEQLERYPEIYHGGNGKHAYADVEAIHVSEADQVQPLTLLRESWQRYKIPIAVTEVHVNATREEQVRWFMEIWDAALNAQAEGIDVRAITAWGLLGHYDWHCLVTRCERYYESGVYDLRGNEPRPTLLAKVLKDLSTEQKFDHPLLNQKPWWKRDIRVRYPSVITESQDSFNFTNRPNLNLRLVLITGGRGTLAQAYARHCERRGIPYCLLSRDQLDIADLKSIQNAFEIYRPWAVINAAGYVRVDQAENDAEKCQRENIYGAFLLAQQCAAFHVKYLTFSSDLVFDGSRDNPYSESSPVAPLNVYGKTKAEAEQLVLRVHPDALVIRTSAFFSPWDKYNFVSESLTKLKTGEKVKALSDVKVSPTYLPDLVDISLDLMIDNEKGIWHLTNQGETTWSNLALTAARMAGLKTTGIDEVSLDELNLPARRPKYSALVSERGILMPPLDHALERYISTIKQELNL